MPATAAKRAPESAPRRDTTVNLRLSAQARDLIDAAAAASGISRTEFMVESARRRAIDVMLDERLIGLEADEWRAFARALDEPPLPNTRLKELMARPAPWPE